MKTSKSIQINYYPEISNYELFEIRAGAIPVAAVALIVAAGKLVLDASYYLGYAVGYIQARYE